MHKKTLNIISVCIVALIIVFSVTHKSKINLFGSDNITVDENGKVITKADQYQANIIETVAEENVKNFQKFAKTFEKSKDDNLTDGLSKDIFTQYIKYNTSGEIKPEAILNASNELLKNKAGLENPTTYADIKISASNVANLKAYGNNVALIQNGVNAGILSIQKKTDKTPYLAGIYGTAAKLFLQIEVPESLAESHLQLINGLRKYSEGLYTMQEQNKDPAKALLGLTKVKDATDEIVEGFEKIRKTIILNKVVYTESEAGYAFTSGK